MANARLAAVQALTAVVEQGQSSREIFPLVFADLNARDKAFAQAIALGCLRHYEALQQSLKALLKKPFKAKDVNLELALCTGLYQLLFLRTDDHAAINETVELSRQLDHAWASKLFNAVLRNAQRQREELLAGFEKSAHKHHPLWLREHLQADWGSDWKKIVLAGNQQAPMVLRARGDRDSYLQQLADADITATAHPIAGNAIQLDSPVDVQALPGFSGGACSVQDAAAQLASQLLAPQDGERILDACAAPGGKTGHLLELANCQVTALELDARRAKRIDENLQRLGLTKRCEVKIADGTQLEDWWDSKPFDRILLDAPCSATGVIRRHPDIKRLRQAEDIPPLLAIQAQLLRTLWKTLKPGGQMLYATCSILADENQRQIEAFLASETSASLSTIELDCGADTSFGRQLFPGAAGMDGFFLCRLQKSAKESP